MKDKKNREYKLVKMLIDNGYEVYVSYASADTGIQKSKNNAVVSLELEHEYLPTIGLTLSTSIEQVKKMLKIGKIGASSKPVECKMNNIRY